MRKTLSLKTFFEATVKTRLPVRSLSLSARNPKKIPTHRRLASPPTSVYDIMGPPPSLLQLTLLGNGHLGSPKSVVVRAERRVYIFNCGEGTQRSLVEFSGGVGKIENIFFTGNSWSHVGGTVGMFLTLKDAKSTSVTFHGPRNVANLIPFFRACEFDAGVNTVDNVAFAQTRGKDGTWRDEQVVVRYVPLVTDRSSSGGGAADSGTDTEEEAEAYAYLVDPVPLKPKLDMFKAMQLKIPKGPLLGRLVDGESVTLEDGRVVTPEEVTLPAATCGTIAIVDVARMDQLAALKRHPAWKELNRPAVVVHLTPDHILEDEEYVKWANSLQENISSSSSSSSSGEKDPSSPSILHLLVSPSALGFPSFASARNQYKLNRVHPDFFPLLPHQIASTTPPKTTSTTTSRLLSRFAPACLSCQPGFNMTVRPPEALSALAAGAPRGPKMLYDEDEFAREMEENAPDLEEAIEEMRGETLTSEKERRGKSRWPQVVFLGTTSAIPLKDRNVSGILVRRSESQSVILDCGESTSAQLNRRYGDEADPIFRTINLIFISHNHTDHHIGLPGLILARRSAFESAGEKEPPLFLVIPERIRDWLVKFNEDIVRVLDNVVVIKSQDIFHSRVDPSLMADVKKRTRLSDIQVCYVHHCSQSFGVSIVDEDGWKLTFSGDTKPCENLVKMGQSSDLLIHEATMEDGWEAEADKKRHSTTTQAIRIGKSMKARLIILTHFSGRYKMIPLPNEEETMDRVGLAFDFASFSFLRDAEIIPRVIKPLQKLFAKHLELEEEKALKRRMRLEDEEAAKKRKLRAEEKATLSNGSAEPEPTEKAASSL